VKVSIVRTGGLAGVTLEASLEAAQLAPPLAQEMEGLVARVNFGGGPSVPLAAAPSPAAFRYALTVEQAGTVRHVEVVQDALDLPTADLVEFVLKVARGKGKLRTRRA
jgi:hypothetical protein